MRILGTDSGCRFWMWILGADLGSIPRMGHEEGLGLLGLDGVNGVSNISSLSPCYCVGDHESIGQGLAGEYVMMDEEMEATQEEASAVTAPSSTALDVEGEVEIEGEVHADVAAKPLKESQVFEGKVTRFAPPLTPGGGEEEGLYETLWSDGATLYFGETAYRNARMLYERVQAERVRMGEKVLEDVSRKRKHDEVEQDQGMISADIQPDATVELQTDITVKIQPDIAVEIKPEVSVEIQPDMSMDAAENDDDDDDDEDDDDDGIEEVDEEGEREREEEGGNMEIPHLDESAALGGVDSYGGGGGDAKRPRIDDHTDSIPITWTGAEGVGGTGTGLGLGLDVDMAAGGVVSSSTPHAPPLVRSKYSVPYETVLKWRYVRTCLLIFFNLTLIK